MNAKDFLMRGINLERRVETIKEQIEKVKEDCCDEICKHLEKANRGEILTDELNSICEDCPLSKL